MDQHLFLSEAGKPLEINSNNGTTEIKEQAIKITLNLLNSENIAYIIYVDDKFDIEGQYVVYKALMSKIKNNRNYIEDDIFDSIDWRGPSGRFEVLIQKLWDSSENKSELLHKVCMHLQDEDAANIIPALEIKEYYGDRIKLMTPDQWVEDSYNSIKKLEEGERVLCLFDYEFQGGNSLTEGRNGAQLVKLLVEKEEYSGKVVCGIFSHKFTEVQEDSFRNKYSADYDMDVSHFYTLSKERFTSDPHITGFAEGIKSLLLLPYVEQLKSEALKTLEESNTKASERIKKMTPKTFNQVIQKSSLKEGVWEVSTLFRIYGILMREENFNMIADSSIRQGFNKSIEKIRQIDSKDTGYTSQVPNDQLIRLRNSELYLTGETINKLHLPLKNGDVFEIKGKEYILLVQPCNLALRAHGPDCGKRDYRYDAGMLVPIKRIPKEKQQNATSEEILVAKRTDEIMVAYFPDFRTVSLNYLDLCVFNPDGKAEINFGTTELINEVIHFPWLKRYEYIHKALLPYENRIEEFKTVQKATLDSIEVKRGALKNTKESENKKLKKEIGRLKYHLKNTETRIFEIEDLRLFNIDCNKIYNDKSRTLDTNIRRVRHYTTPYADHLLQQFMLYLSRNAFEHDFTIN